MMRLLAYGGISHAERCRIGTWRGIKEGTLDDSYGLHESEFCFGVGFSEATSDSLDEDSRTPFIILRQLQNQHDRGGYAFTLLLDPGTEVWQAFAWNAAALMNALLTEESTRELLLIHPETTDLNQLSQILCDAMNCSIGSYLPINGRQSSDQVFSCDEATTNRFAHLLTDSAAHGTAPIVSIAINAESLDLPSHPTLAEISTWLNHTPPCFRLGNGWLFGGSRTHGEVLKAQLVFDDGVANSNTEEQEARGRRIVTAWSNVIGDAEISASVKECSQVPCVWWRKNFGIDAARLNRQVTQLSEMLIAANNPQSSADDLKRLLPPAFDIQADEPLAGEISVAAYRLALAHEETLTPALTKLLLHTALENLAPASEQSQPSAPLPAAALEWLASLNNSKLREHLSIEDKTRLASHISGAWSHLDCVRRLVAGESCDKAQQLSQRERETLQQDLHEMLAHDADAERPTYLTERPPLLHSLVQLFGSLPLPIIKSFDAQQPHLKWNNETHDWLQGWLATNRTDIYEREAARLLAEGDGLNDLSSNELAEFLDIAHNQHVLPRALMTLLYEDNIKSNQYEFGERLKWLLSVAPPDARHVALGEALDELFEDEERESVFGSRYATDPHALESLFSVMGEKAQMRVLKLLKAYDEDAFVQSACKVFRFAQRAEASLQKKAPRHHTPPAKQRAITAKKDEYFRRNESLSVITRLRDWWRDEAPDDKQPSKNQIGDEPLGKEVPTHTHKSGMPASDDLVAAPHYCLAMLRLLKFSYNKRLREQVAVICGGSMHARSIGDFLPSLIKSALNKVAERDSQEMPAS